MAAQQDLEAAVNTPAQSQSQPSGSRFMRYVQQRRTRESTGNSRAGTNLSDPAGMAASTGPTVSNDAGAGGRDGGSRPRERSAQSTAAEM